MSMKKFGIIVGLVFVLVVPLASEAATAVELQARLDELLAQVKTLQARLASLTTGPCNFSRDLSMGVSGEDVRCLQRYLNSAGFTVAASGAGSSGSETIYFGALTKAAVSKWQTANNISPALGYFGPLSRAKYLQLTAPPAAPTPAPPSPPAEPAPTPAPAPATPEPAPLPANRATVSQGAVMSGIAAYRRSIVPFLNFDLAVDREARLKELTVGLITSSPQAPLGLVLATADEVGKPLSSGQVLAFGPVDYETLTAKLAGRTGASFEGKLNLTVSLAINDLLLPPGYFIELELKSLTLEDAATGQVFSAEIGSLKTPAHFLSNLLRLASTTVEGLAADSTFSSLVISSDSAEGVNFTHLVLSSSGGSISTGTTTYQCLPSFGLEKCYFAASIGPERSLTITPASGKAKLTELFDLSVQGDKYGYQIMPKKP